MSKMMKLLFGDPNKKMLSNLRKEVDKINDLESGLEQLSDNDLKQKTTEFKDRLKNGETLDDIAHEAFAVVREASKRTLAQRHFDVQIMGGWVMHKSGIAEMRTGEGKTLTSTLPLYLNALKGKGCHLVTVNDYLAMRDAIWMGQIYNFLGMTVGCIQQFDSFIYDPSYKNEQDTDTEKESDTKKDQTGAFHAEEDYAKPCSRKEAYSADITYGTNNQFGFDFLRDNMSQSKDDMVMGELHYAIIDEIDSILIDEARTPLIISAPAEESNKLYYRFADIIKTLHENEDFNIDEKMRASTLTDAGIEKIEQILGIDNLYSVDQGTYQRYADTALRARANYKKDIHYIVKEDEVVIVDEFTGRLMPGRRFSEGIHQAIEAKEGTEIKRESQTLATVTFQNLFRMYDKLSGMTGTAATEAEEFSKIYELDVVEIPTNKQIARLDYTDKVYKNEKGKLMSVIKDIKEKAEKGQPVLVGTASVEKNELLHELLKREGVKHEILNAKNHTREADIIAQAGSKGSITLATNMAGRGVDIKLGGNPCTPEEEEEVKSLGGLHVIGTERHESRRIDNQLRGRSGRQGDPGSTQFYLSMEDELMRIFGSDRARSMMDKLGIPDDMPIENKMITSSVEKAQERVEGHNFDSRKHLLEYDDVLNKHREVIYARRSDVLDTFTKTPEKIRERIIDIIEGEVEQVVLFHTGEVFETSTEKQKPDWNIKEITETVNTIIPLTETQLNDINQVSFSASKDKADVIQGRTNIIEKIMTAIHARYDDLYDLFEDDKELYNIEKAVILRAVDMLWIDHLEAMRALRTGIGLRGYGQRDPLLEYKKEGYHLFQHLLASINNEITYTFFKYGKHAVDMKVQAELNKSLLSRTGVVLSGAAKTMDGTNSSKVVVKNSSGPKIGRNEPCSCGSGKKYKKCHGK